MLCYYGLTMQADSAASRSAYDKINFYEFNNIFSLWPEYVRQRLHSTYAYLAGSLTLTAGAGVAAARSPALLSLVSAPSLLVWIGSLAAIMATGIIVQKIDYASNSMAKHLAWAAHCAVLGAVLAPLCALGGPALMRAAWYTAGLGGGLLLPVIV